MASDVTEQARQQAAGKQPQQHFVERDPGVTEQAAVAQHVHQFLPHHLRRGQHEGGNIRPAHRCQPGSE